MAEDQQAGVIAARELGWLAEFYEKWVEPEWTGREPEQRTEAEAAWRHLAGARARLNDALATGESEGSPFVAVLREFAFAEAMYDRVVRRSASASQPGGETAAGRIDGFVEGFEAGFELAYFLASQAQEARGKPQARSGRK